VRFGMPRNDDSDRSREPPGEYISRAVIAALPNSLCAAGVTAARTFLRRQTSPSTKRNK